MAKSKRILIVPLDWGLGHAARCIPIIREQLGKGHEVVLASNGRSKALLQQYFPQLHFLPDPPDYAVRYNSSGSFWWKMILQIPHLLKTIRREHEWLKQLQERYRFDEVISDNRYGLYLPNVRSVIITHQTAPIVPGIVSGFVHRKISSWLERFEECWIPDYKDEATSLGGKLSHTNVPSNARYIGPLSRFRGMDVTKDETYTQVAIVSGPEPSRSIFLEKMKAQFHASSQPSLIVCGSPELSYDKSEGSIRLVSHLDDRQLASYLKGAKEVHSRSGYSSLMDYHVLGITTAILTATPGQTEQEYLAKRDRG